MGGNTYEVGDGKLPLDVGTLFHTAGGQMLDQSREGLWEVSLEALST